MIAIIVRLIIIPISSFVDFIVETRFKNKEINSVNVKLDYITENKNKRGIN